MILDSRVFVSDVSETKATEAKATEIKTTEAKATETKATETKTTETKTTETKATEAKATETKATEAKTTEAKTTETKTTEAKTTEAKTTEDPNADAEAEQGRGKEIHDESMFKLPSTPPHVLPKEVPDFCNPPQWACRPNVPKVFRVKSLWRCGGTMHLNHKLYVSEPEVSAWVWL